MRTYDGAASALQELMELREMTPQSLAEALEIDPALVRRILSGKQKNISTRVMAGLARVLDISLMELIDRFY